MRFNFAYCTFYCNVLFSCVQKWGYREKDDTRNAISSHCVSVEARKYNPYGAFMTGALIT